MVNIPKRRSTFCKSKTCRKHTLHFVAIYKAGKKRKFSLGTRRYHRKMKGYGGKGKPVLRNREGNTMPGFQKKAKTTKIVTLRLICEKCGHSHLQAIGRAKHVEVGGPKKRISTEKKADGSHDSFVDNGLDSL